MLKLKHDNLYVVYIEPYFFAIDTKYVNTLNSI